MIRKKNKNKLIFGIVVCFFLVLIFSANQTFAASKYWIGSNMGSTTDNTRWSFTSGGSGGVFLPHSYDTVFYNSSGLGSSTVSADMTLSNLYIDSAYTGNLIVNDNVNYIIGLPSVPASVTVSGNGQQIATTTTPTPNNHQDLGGAFLFTSRGDTTVTSIRLKQVGSLATSSLSNIVLTYKNAEGGNCATTTPSDASIFGTVVSFNASSTATTTGVLPLFSDIPVCLYINYNLSEVFSLAVLGRSIDFEIINPVTDIVFINGSVSTTGSVDINSQTIIVNDRTIPVIHDPNPNHDSVACSGSITSTISLNMSNPEKNPTVFYLQNCSVWKRTGEDTAQRITNPNLQVQNLIFSDLSGDNSKRIIGIELTIANMDTGSSNIFLNVSRTYRTSARVRASP